MAQWRNTGQAYGLVARFFHWTMAVAILAIFGLGLWMTELNYYHPWYKSAPDLHRSVGMLLLAMLTARLAWRLINAVPDNSGHPPLVRRASHLLHWGFYALLFAVMVSGYLISTVDGREISVFGLFSVPSVYQSPGLEDVAGEIHEFLANTVIVLVVLHVLAALKHHFIDRDATLTRMAAPLSDRK